MQVRDRYVNSWVNLVARRCQNLRRYGRLSRGRCRCRDRCRGRPPAILKRARRPEARQPRNRERQTI